MTLVNQTISHYRIVLQIGAGGMGEVYRARDTKLGRDVAIKVLPASLSENADRLNRFEQEAQAAGALHDGQRFPVGTLIGDTKSPRPTVILNWPAALKK